MTGVNRMQLSKHGMCAWAVLLVGFAHTALAQQQSESSAANEIAVITFTDGTTETVTFDGLGQPHLPDQKSSLHGTPISVERVPAPAPVMRLAVAAPAKVAAMAKVAPAPQLPAHAAAETATALVAASGGHHVSPPVFERVASMNVATADGCAHPNPAGTAAAPPVATEEGSSSHAVPAGTAHCGTAAVASAAAIHSIAMPIKPNAKPYPVRWIGPKGWTVKQILEAWTSSDRTGAIASGWKPVIWTLGTPDTLRVRTEINAPDFDAALKELIAASMPAHAKEYPLAINRYRLQQLIVVSAVPTVTKLTSAHTKSRKSAHAS